MKQVSHANKLFVLLTYDWKQLFNALISSGLCNYEVLIRHVITIMKTVFSNNWVQNLKRYEIRAKFLPHRTLQILRVKNKDII